MTLRLQQIDQAMARLSAERSATAAALGRIAGPPAVQCPRCGHEGGFLTDNGGYLARVLEDEGDTEALEDGKALYCPDCGDVFLWSATPAKG